MKRTIWFLLFLFTGYTSAQTVTDSVARQKQAKIKIHIADSLNNLALKLAKPGSSKPQLNQALKYIMQGLHIYSVNQDSVGLRRSADNLSLVYTLQKKYSQAKWFILQSNTLSREKNDTPNIICSLVKLAAIKTAIKDYALAQDDLKEAEEMAAVPRFGKLKITVQQGLANYYDHKNEGHAAALALNRMAVLNDSLARDSALKVASLLVSTRRDSVTVANQSLALKAKRTNERADKTKLKEQAAIWITISATVISLLVIGFTFYKVTKARLPVEEPEPILNHLEDANKSTLSGLVIESGLPITELKNMDFTHEPDPQRSTLLDEPTSVTSYQDKTITPGMTIESEPIRQLIEPAVSHGNPIFETDEVIQQAYHETAAEDLAPGLIMPETIPIDQQQTRQLLVFPQSKPEPVYAETRRIKASPLARLFAKENGINLSKITGSTGDAVIIKSDVENYLEKMKQIIPVDDNKADITTLLVEDEQPAYIETIDIQEPNTAIKLESIPSIIEETISKTLNEEAPTLIIEESSATATQKSPAVTETPYSVREEPVLKSALKTIEVPVETPPTVTLIPAVIEISFPLEPVTVKIEPAIATAPTTASATSTTRTPSPVTSEAPHFYITMSIDMDQAVEARNKINAYAPSKVSFNDLVLKATAIALKKHPNVNSSWLGDKIRYNEHVNIGVAVAVDEGLLVPVIRFADGKSLSHISAEVKDFAAKAKAKKLQPADWEGSTFTISNLGMFGVDEFTAIINPPDSCILAVSGIQQVPVVKNGAVVPGNVMKVNLSCDHRVVDGATGTLFLQTLKALLEEPVRLLF